VLTKESSIIELGQLTLKELRGRENDGEITVCDLTGTGVQDTAIALFAYNEMAKRNLGIKVENKTLSLKN
jgi:ornithine cyclodeaminase/alanine dehydrogenase-like protein (mu-crystallin family)